MGEVSFTKKFKQISLNFGKGSSTERKNKQICWEIFVNETSPIRLTSHYKVVEAIEIYQMRHSKVKSDVVKYAKISQQIWPF